MAGFIAHDGSGLEFNDRDEMLQVDRRQGEGQFDFAIWGRRFLANPDLIKRMAADVALNEPDVETFYTTGPVGYLDYPVLQPTT
jgi:2,4-dienoyl-CoA reductase-like NADH-dependent reductase (Old Yellow Enzyme family)